MTRGDSTELAAALRQWRERLTPADVGLPAGPRRRTPGLRREEVARLAGVSVDYVVQDLPAMLVDARRSLLAWNPLADALMGDLSAIPRERRNLLWMRFGPPIEGHPLVLDEHGDRERLDRSAVADVRAALGRYPDDQVLRGMVDDLSRRSERFARLWAERPVQDRRVDRKSYEVPGIGRIILDCDQLAVPDDDQLLIVYSAAPGSPDAEKLDLLRVVGLQTV